MIDDDDDRDASGRRRFSKEFYDQLVAAFREMPGNASNAARAARCDRRTASRAWERGWCDLKSVPRVDWARPIRDVIDEDKLLARATLSRDDQRKRDLDDLAYRDVMRDSYAKAQNDLAESRALLGRSVRAARSNAVAFQSVTTRLIKGAIVLSDRIERLMTDPTWKPEPEVAMRLLRQVGQTLLASNDAARIADEMERKALGEPDVLVGIGAVAPMTQSEAAREFVQNARAARRMLARGMIPPEENVDEILDAEFTPANDTVDSDSDAATH